MRNEDYYQLNHLTKYFYKKGITARAEKIMKDVYNEVRANKDRYEPVRSCEMIERAYQDAFEYVLCYFNDDDRWLYLEANEEYRKGIGDWDFGVYTTMLNTIKNLLILWIMRVSYLVIVCSIAPIGCNTHISDLA